jgi:prefoldin subunit 5
MSDNKTIFTNIMREQIKHFEAQIECLLDTCSCYDEVKNEVEPLEAQVHALKEQINYLQ